VVVIIPTPAFRVPAPVKIIEALVPVLSVVISPETVTVPVVIVSWCLTAVPPLVNAMLPAFKMPAPTAREFKVAARGMVIAPDTVKVTPELMFRFAVVEAVVKVTEAHAAAAVTVTVKPPSMVTVSPATGTDAPLAPPEVADQVLVAFQFPLATEKRLAAWTVPAPSNTAASARNEILTQTWIPARAGMSVRLDPPNIRRIRFARPPRRPVNQVFMIVVTTCIALLMGRPGKWSSWWRCQRR
jgi:hypothetical protein